VFAGIGPPHQFCSLLVKARMVADQLSVPRPSGFCNALAPQPSPKKTLIVNGDGSGVKGLVGVSEVGGKPVPQLNMCIDCIANVHRGSPRELKKRGPYW
jgi:hypothetical protein